MTRITGIDLDHIVGALRREAEKHLEMVGDSTLDIANILRQQAVREQELADLIEGADALVMEESS